MVTTYRDEYGNILYQDWVYLYTDCVPDGENGGGGNASAYYDCNGTLNGTAYVESCGCIGGTTGISFCPKNPCLEKVLHSLRASDAVNLANKNTIIPNSTVNEWGAEQKVSNPFGMPDGTAYVVSINDWAAPTALHNTYNANPTIFNQNFQQDGSTYLSNNNSTDAGLAGSWALLVRFGSSINIYKSAPGSTSLEPLRINPTNFYDVAINNCP